MNPFAPRENDPVVKLEKQPKRRGKDPAACPAPKRARTVSSSSSSSSVLSRMPAVPTAPLALPLPEHRSASLPKHTTPTLESPEFEKQCKLVYGFLEENVKRALAFLTAGNPMLQKRQDRDKAHEKKLDIQAVYSQIILHDFDMEQELLFFAGKPRQSPLNPKLQFTARPCMQGSNCIAMVAGALERVPHEGAPNFEPAPLMQICTREELDAMYKLGITPSEMRACLRCVRHALSSAVAIKEKMSEPWPPSMVLQWFGNKTECEQGYAHNLCILPSKTAFNGLYYPMVVEYDDLLQVRWDPTTKGYFVDQSGLAAKQHVIRGDFPKQIWERVRNAAKKSSPSDFPQGAAVQTTTSGGSSACCSDKRSSLPSSAH